MRRMKEEYKGLQIEINEVPDRQFEFDGFGWAYQIFRETELLFSIVIKATFGKDNKDNVQASYKWGIRKITSMIDMNTFEKEKTYCFQWSALSKPPKEVNCDGFL